jgi:hypothetical protein
VFPKWLAPKYYKQCQSISRAREAEESALLEAVAREQLGKAQQDGKGLESAVVICKVWRLALAL